MDAQTAYDFIERGALMAGMRGVRFTPENALKVTGVLMEVGINVFEVTMNSTQPVEVMQTLKREYGAEACVGMGTVLDTDTAKQVLDAGADFVVSPAFQPEVVQVVLNANVLVAPGIITPSEAVAAWTMGVKLLKIFPIGVLGADYLKTILGPLDHMKFMCNGGINAENAREFLKAGALACGMAAWLTGDGTTPLDTIRQRARLLCDVVEEVRTGRKLLTV